MLASQNVNSDGSCCPQQILSPADPAHAPKKAYVDKMNLGNVYLETLFHISGVAVLIATTTSIALYAWKRIHVAWVVAIFLALSFILVFVGNSLFHRDMFVTRHLEQNKYVPQTGCTSYQPSFGYLFATYSMSRGEFDTWVTSHPWELQPYNLDSVDRDSARLGFSDPDAAFATEMAGNGNQLRVYFQDGTMYLSYNVM